MNWKVILLLACVAISIATYSKKADREESQRELARAAVQLEIRTIERRFVETTGATKEWLEGAGCDDARSPLYTTQRAIQETGEAVFNVRLDDIVDIKGQTQLRADYWSVGECLFAPNISMHAWITDEQIAELRMNDAGRFDDYLLAMDVADTQPDDRGIVVTGKLIAIAARGPKK